MFGTADNVSLLLLPVVTIPRVDIIGTNEPKVVGRRRLDLLMGVLPSIKQRVEEEDDLLYHIPLPTQTILLMDPFNGNALLAVLILYILIYAIMYYHQCVNRHPHRYISSISRARERGAGRPLALVRT